MLTLEVAYLMCSKGPQTPLAQCGRELLQGVNIRKHSSLGAILEAGYHKSYGTEFVFYSRRFRVVV